MKKLLILSTAMGLALGLSATAMAADLALKAPPPAENWTGIYVGANAAQGWGHEDWIFNSLGVAIPAAPSPPPLPSVPVSGSSSYGGTTGGFQTGIDFQMGRIVYGLLASYEFIGPLDSNSLINGVPLSSNMRYLAEGGGRLGYAVGGGWLPYIKGGAAGTHVDNTAGNTWGPTTPANSAMAISGRDRTGWFVGGGVEVKTWRGISLFAEYDHYDFGTATDVYNVTVPTTANFLAFLSSSTLREDVVKVGLNWHPDFLWQGR